MPDFRAAIRDYIRREAKPCEKYGHQPRLYALTREIGKELTYDDDVVFAAAWLHDLGVFFGHRPEETEALAKWDNVAYAMQRAPELLAQFGFPANKIHAVVEAIRTHQASADPQSIEATILRDADILEQLGAVGILRTVCKVGRDSRFADFTAAVHSLRSAFDSLPQKLRLESSRHLAAQRVALLRTFLAAVDAEAGPDLG